MDPLSFRLQIKDRLQKTKIDVAATLDLLLSLREKVRAKKDAAGRRPRASEQELEQQIRDIEFDISTTNMSKKDHDAKLRQISKIRQQLASFDVFKEIDALNYECKVTQERLDLQRQAVKELTSGLRKLEVISLIFRHQKIQISLKDVVEKDLALQDSVVGDFIGTKGRNLKKLEADHCVVLDYEARYKVVHICGAKEGVESAIAAIEEINSYETVDIEIDQSAASVIHSRSTLKESLETKHNVRVDAPSFRRPGSAAAAAVTGEKTARVSIRGPPARIQAAADEIRSIVAQATAVKVPRKLVTFVVGQQGATIQQLQRTHGVTIMVPETGPRSAYAAGSSPNENVVCKVYGDAQGRDAAVAAIHTIIDENKFVQEDVPLPPEAVAYFIGPSGSRIQAFRKQHSVRANVRANQPFVTLRGTKAAIASAASAVSGIIEDFKRENVERVVSRLEYNLIVGSRKSGKLAAIRDETGLRQLQGAAPSSEKPGRLFLSGPVEAIDAAQAAIDRILADVQRAEIEIHDVQKRFIIGPKGSVISKIQKSTGAFLILDGNSVKISGLGDSTAKAEAQVKEICDAHVVAEVEVPSSYIGEIIGQKGRAIKAFGEQHNVNVNLPKPSSGRSAQTKVTVVIHGEGEKVSAAEAAMVSQMEKFFRCNKEMKLHPVYATHLFLRSQKIVAGIDGAQILSTDRRRGRRRGSGGSGDVILRVASPEDMEKLEAAIAANVGEYALKSTPSSPSDTVKVVEGYIGVVIGKGGAEIRRLESEHGVLLEVADDKSGIVIVGPSEDAVSAARDDILGRLRRMVKLDVSVEARLSQLEKIFGPELRSLRRLQQQHGGFREVNVSTSPSSVNKKNVTVRIKGTAGAVQAIKAAVENAAKGLVTVVIELISPDHARSLLNDSASHLEKIRRECNVRLEVNADVGDAASHVTVSGTQHATAKAEQSLYALLRFNFPGQYQRIAIPQSLVDEILRRQFDPIRELEDAHGAKIQLRKDHLYVRGPSVTECEAGIAQLMADHKALVVSLAVDNDMMGTIIGPKGKTISGIVADAGGNNAVRIDLDRDTSTVLIKGKTKEATAAAKAAIEAIVEAEKAKQVVFNVPPSCAGDIIGRGGANITKIQNETGCRVQLQRDSGRCRIFGPSPEAMQDARARIDAIVEAAEAEQEARQNLRDSRPPRSFSPNGPHISMDVSRNSAAAIIGRGGATIRRLEQDSGCKINVSKETNKCFIVGGTEQAREQAKDMIDEVIAAQVAAAAATAASAAEENGSGSDDDSEVKEAKPRFIVGLGVVSSNNSRRAKRRANKKARSRQVCLSCSPHTRACLPTQPAYAVFVSSFKQEAVDRTLSEVNIPSVAEMVCGDLLFNRFALCTNRVRY